MLETIISCHEPKVALGLVLTSRQSLCGFPCCFDPIAWYCFLLIGKGSSADIGTCRG